MKLNLATILAILGGLGVFAPDVAGLATWLASVNIGWMSYVVRGLGLLAAFFAAAPLVVPRLRAFLALLGLATPPGAQAPWLPSDNLNVVPVPPPAPKSTTPPSPRGPVAPSNLGVLVFLVAAMLSSAAMAQSQPTSPQAVGCIDKANSYCVVPAAAVGWQINLKTGSPSNGVALLGLTLQHTFGSLPLGLGLYGGLGASNDNHGSYQGCIGLSITNWGLLCGGAAHVSFSDNSTAWQGMLTFAGQLTSGGTPAYVTKTAAQAEYQGYAKGISAGGEK